MKGHSDSGLRWDASYSPGSVTEHVTRNQKPVADAPFDYMRGAPEPVIIVGAGYTWQQFEFDLHARWQSEYRDYVQSGFGLGSLRPVLISNYVTATARVAYDIQQNVMVALTAEQFDSSSLATTAALREQRRIIASFTAHF